ncbi:MULTISPECIES: HlyD family secretion protein [unclassified Agarivorans]|uniref:HlyD family secretion protein n=1 Tax=unclassified Agarivorans TaxID=2636026 RepID=UPI0026E33A8C|nr:MULTISPECIES: HlyD family secretion protein [unclassified Agarivorans]MDO6685204.1 HlyD family secretion protein [Agarivorans sp. 3_MG-2023]MDO6715624.1 HlyD family secretion protein [Agarivorans sp. 2_MG-2023]
MSEENPVETNPPVNPLRKSSLVVLLLCILVFIIYVVGDRVTPTTDNARVFGFVVPVAASVSGKLVNVSVTNNQLVKKGQPLAKVAEEEYVLAVQQAEAALELAGQEIGAGTAGVSAAQARLLEANTSYQSILTDANRLFAVEDKNVVPQQNIDRARNDVAKAKATVAKATAELEQAKQSLGVSGDDNPKLQSALAKLGKARLDLSKTVILAPSDGGVTNLQLEAGYYANKGQPIMTFVTTKDVWVEAYMRENNIANVKNGDPVEIALDVAPGKIFKGEVVSIGFAVNFGQSNNLGVLPSIPQTAGWLRDPQRFPVIIKFSDDSAYGLRRIGAQADVTIHTEGTTLMKVLAKISLRVKSWLSYVY